MWEKETPIEQHISNMQTILQLYVGDEMSGPALKINIYVTWPTRFLTWFLSVPGINSKKSISPAYVIAGLLKRLQIRALVTLADVLA